MDTCTCTPGTSENGWHEQRCRSCQEAERRSWDRIPVVLEQIRALGIDAWTAEREAEDQRALYDYLGMERAR